MGCIKIALFEPEIPQNTGNIARLTAGTDVELILVGRLGFSLSDKYVRRAGLDYWDSVKLSAVGSIDKFFEIYDEEQCYYAFISKFGEKRYTSIYDDSAVKHNCIIIFGNESYGLPDAIREKYKDFLYRIPMNSNIRSLNLSNSAAVVLYELLRRDNFRLLG